MVNDNGRLPYIKIMKKMQKKRNLWKNWNGDKMKRSVMPPVCQGRHYVEAVKK